MFWCLHLNTTYLWLQPVKSLQKVSKQLLKLTQPNKHPAELLSVLPRSQRLLSWFYRARSSGRYQLSRAADQQPCIYTHRRTYWLTNWLTEWLRLGGWMTDYHWAGGSRAETLPSPTSWLSAWLEGRLNTRSTTLTCSLSWWFTSFKNEC